MSKTTCSMCFLPKTRMLIERRRNKLVYIDDQQRRWRGKVCPDCSKLAHKHYMRSVRGSKVGPAQCEYCQKEYQSARKDQKYCSADCRKKAKRSRVEEALADIGL